MKNEVSHFLIFTPFFICIVSYLSLYCLSLPLYCLISLIINIISLLHFIVLYVSLFILSLNICIVRTSYIDRALWLVVMVICAGTAVLMISENFSDWQDNKVDYSRSLS